MADKTFNTSSPSATSAIFGAFDINVTLIEKAFNVKIVNRPSNNDIGDCVTVSGDDENVKNAYEVLIYLNKMASMNNIITEQSVDYAISMVNDSDLKNKLLIFSILPLFHATSIAWRIALSTLLALVSNLSAILGYNFFVIELIISGLSIAILIASRKN